MRMGKAYAPVMKVGLNVLLRVTRLLMRDGLSRDWVSKYVGELVKEVTFILFRIASFVMVKRLQTITTRVPDEIYQDIKKIEGEEKAERAEVIRRLLAEAIKRRKLKRALETLREGKMTLRSAAKLAGLTYIEMMDEVEKAGIPVDYTVANLRIELDAIKKKEH